LLVGAGGMAIDYAAVLSAQEMTFDVVGRGVSSAELFEAKTGIRPHVGGLETYLASSSRVPRNAIVAVGVDELAKSALQLLRTGVHRILLEKPGGLNVAEIEAVARAAEMHQAEVYVAYNRRFYAATRRARDILAEDGGVTSFNFEFTEWSHVIERLTLASEVKAQWLLANSTHVIDLAFFLGGQPATLCAYVTGGLPWHPSGSVFAGAGITSGGALFIYQANWSSPGRWGVELLTKSRRVILRPLEKLQVQMLGSVTTEFVELDDQLDRQYKPGVYRQVSAFLGNVDAADLLSIRDHAVIASGLFAKIAGSGDRLSEVAAV